jgi:hypothetical protein
VTADRLSGLRAAASHLRAAEHAAQRASEEHGKIVARREVATGAKRKIAERRERADVAAILGNKQIARDRAALKGATGRETEVAAIMRALPVAQQGCDAAEECVRLVAAQLNAAKAAWASSEQEGACEILVEQLSALAPSLARLRALDEVQVGLIRAGTIFNKGAAPPVLWSGSIIVARLVAGLLPRVKPSGLSDEALNRLTARAVAILNKELLETTP